ncbi:helix-turn-helix domain-containing protein [Pasteurellaceae bacterium HPA106]|uniref:helix-turn-helix domain-containing protein n=1 Tax=Spirabiliibacterium pneumoniae TaxID=221400 RepID=UPI001F2F66EA|nr:helix-turn-helix domain-containing protein [Spirabiliibacterium pneumoniae]MBE2895737.1 helix-turn-helix domain-containing protein [Spirabiliibacterium pneumoniae]
MKEQTYKDMNTDDVLRALIADEPELAAQSAELKEAIEQMKRGEYARKMVVHVHPIVETRNKAGLSQSKFAEKLGISVNTLKSWEQGQRKPSGAAAALIKLLSKRPELVGELS